MRELSVPCGHAACNCTVNANVDAVDRTYCSEDCRDAESGGIEIEGCACGHPPCDEA
jgi:hypothetical protein